MELTTTQREQVFGLVLDAVRQSRSMLDSLTPEGVPWASEDLLETMVRLETEKLADLEGLLKAVRP